MEALKTIGDSATYRLGSNFERVLPSPSYTITGEMELREADGRSRQPKKRSSFELGDEAIINCPATPHSLLSVNVLLSRPGHCLGLVERYQLERNRRVTFLALTGRIRRGVHRAASRHVSGRHAFVRRCRRRSVRLL